MLRLYNSLTRKIDKIITVEENALQGGFGSAVLEVLERNGVAGCKMKRMGIPDEFVEHGSQKELRTLYNIDAAGIEKAVIDIIKTNVSERKRAS